MADLVLPSRSSGSTRRTRSPALPTAGDVPQVQSRQDPGVRIPPLQSSEGIIEAGKGLASFGQDLSALALRQQERTDAIARAEDFGKASNGVTEIFRTYESGRDLSNEADLLSFRDEMDKNINDALTKHQGSSDSRAKLQVQLQTLKTGLSDRAAVMSTIIGREKIERVTKSQFNFIVEDAVKNPGSLAERLTEIDRVVDDKKAGLPVGVEAKLRATGKETVALAVVQSFLDKGSPNAAEQLLQRHEFVGNLSPDAQRQIRSRIAVARHEEGKITRDAQQKLQSFKIIAGRDPTDEERLRLAGIQPREGRQTLAQKIAELEGVTGKAASPEQIAKLAGAATPEDRMFGAGITGRALEIMTESAPTFSAGLTSEAEDRRFLAAITQYTQPKQIQNPDTGIMETTRPTLPVFVSEALQRRGFNLPSDQPAQMPAPSPAPTTQEQPSSLGTGQEQGGQAPRNLPTTSGKTVFDLAGLITGPVPAAAEAASRTPLVGQVFRAPQITQARTFMSQAQRDLVRVLQNNPRFAEGERRAIEKEVDISPSVFDDPNAFKDRMIGVDDALSNRLKNALNTAQSNRVGKEERIQAMNIANAIVNFRELLGVPPRVKTVKDAEELMPGTLFIDPKGMVRRVPGGSE